MEWTQPNPRRPWRVAGVIGLICITTGCATPRQLAPPNLYERLGSLPGIETVVSDFTNRTFSDPRVRAHFALTKRSHFNRWMAEFVCAGTGGPCQYTGKSMKERHADMAITPADFQAVVENLVAALDAHGVAARDKQDLLTLLGGAARGYRDALRFKEGLRVIPLFGQSSHSAASLCRSEILQVADGRSRKPVTGWRK